MIHLSFFVFLRKISLLFYVQLNIKLLFRTCEISCQATNNWKMKEFQETKC